MNEGYNDGQALLNLAQAYKGSGDNENATVYFQKVIEKYAGSEYAAEVRADLLRLQMKIINTLRKKKEMPGGMSFFCIGNEPKSGLARDLGDCLQSRNVPFGTSGDYIDF